jgi:hypothetical protein
MIQYPKGKGKFGTACNPGIVQLDADIFCTTILQIPNLCKIENRRNPIARQDEHNIKTLEGMHCCALGTSEFIVIEKDQWLCSETIWVSFVMIGIRMMLCM